MCWGGPSISSANFDKASVGSIASSRRTRSRTAKRAVLQLTGGTQSRSPRPQYARGTIKNHVSNILSKLGVRDRTRAVLKAIESGLL